MINAQKIFTFVCSGASIYSFLPIIPKLLDNNIQCKIYFPGENYNITAKQQEELKNLVFSGEVFPQKLIKNITEELPTIFDINSCSNTQISNNFPNFLMFSDPFFFEKTRLNKTICSKLNMKTVYFPYATEFMAANYDKWIVNNSHVKESNIIFTSYIMALNNYKQYSKQNIEKIYNIGNPELDILFNKLYENGSSYQQFKNFCQNAQYCFLYTPHWTIYEPPFDSSLLKIGQQLYDFINSNKDIRLIFRPHPYILKCNTHGKTQIKLQLMKLFEKYKNCSNIIFDNSASAIPAIAASNCLISDCSSIIQKYWPTEKPIIVTEAQYGEASELIYSCLDVINSSEMLINTMQKFINGNDPKKEMRKNKSIDFSGPYDGKCSERMVNILLNEIKQ